MVLMRLFHLIDHQRWVAGHRYEFSPVDPFDDENTTFEDVSEWCGERFGPIKWDDELESRWWIVKPNDFWFRDEQDALEFRLRWC